MKKTLSILALVLLISAMISACGSREQCPGVGQAESVEINIA